MYRAFMLNKKQEEKRMKQMKLYAGILFLVVGLMVTPATAGQVGSNSYNVAHEVLGAAKSINVTAPIVTLGNTLPNGSLVNLSLSGAANYQPGQTYYLCANNSSGSVIIGSGATSTTVLAIVADKIIDLSLNLTSGNMIFLSSSNACTGTASLNVPASSAVGTTTLSGNSVYYGSQLDVFASNTVVGVVNQFSTSLSTADLIQIDYLTGAANGSSVVPVSGASNLLGMSSNKLYVTTNGNVAYGIQQTSGVFNQVVTLSDSHDWSGIRSAFLSTGSNCTAPYTGAVANAPTSGNMTINYANIATSVSTPSAVSVTLCVNVAGNVVLPSRTITGSYAYVGTTGLLSPAGGSAATWQTWIPNGYQAFNPYMYVGSSNAEHTNDVFIRLYNSSSMSAHVYVDVYPADGSATQRLVLADIPSNQAGLYWAADIGTAAGLASGTSYAALFTVTAPKDLVNGVSFMKRTGGERQMPLYKSINGASNYLVE